MGTISKYIINPITVEMSLIYIFFSKKLFMNQFLKYSITCIQWLLKGNNESGLLQEVVFKCRFY